MEGTQHFHCFRIPEKIGHLRESETFRGNWSAALVQERSYTDRNPTILIIGGGHCGLEIAARLKYLGVDALIVEKNERIGDNWRKHYEALSLHDPVCECFMHSVPILCSSSR